MSTTTTLVTILAIVAGFISQAVNTGSVFGIVTVPKAWLPYLTIIGTFTAGFGASIATGVPWQQAILAGLLALGGTTIGVTMHQHLKAMPQGKASNDNGAPPAEEKKAA